MSIALEKSSNCGGIQGSGFIYNSPPDLLAGDQNQEQRNGPCPGSGSLSRASSSSSIGENSDDSLRLSLEVEDSGDTGTEVQSSYKGGCLDAMDALEEVLPIRRGISRFYNGKSKSFTSLAYASSSCSSAQDFAKPDNAYARKRRNLLATSLGWDKNRTSLLRNSGSGISKKWTNLSRTKLALAVAMSATECNGPSDELNSNMNLITRSSPRGSSFLGRPNLSLSPHLPGNFSAYRSFSFADFQHASAATPRTSDSSPLEEAVSLS